MQAAGRVDTILYQSTFGQACIVMDLCESPQPVGTSTRSCLRGHGRRIQAALPKFATVSDAPACKSTDLMRMMFMFCSILQRTVLDGLGLFSVFQFLLLFS